jgi:hypothetical protein
MTSKQCRLSLVGMVGMLGIYKLSSANQARRPTLRAGPPTTAASQPEAYR